MLEHQTLLLGPWTCPARPPSGRRRSGTPEGSTRDIIEPDTGRLLGRARWLAAPERSWLSWLALPVLAVHEPDDEPLVFTVRRLWAVGPRWEVGDADGRRVALVRRDWIFDPFGDCLAWVEPAPEEGSARFHGRDGRELAQLNRWGEHQQLHFAAELLGEPFVKMALLGAVLSGTVDG